MGVHPGAVAILVRHDDVVRTIPIVFCRPPQGLQCRRERCGRRCGSIQTALEVIRVSSRSTTLLFDIARDLPPRLRRECSRRRSITARERKQTFLPRMAGRSAASRAADPLRIETGRHRDARQPGHVHRHGEHVVEIHFDRIGAALLANRESRRRRGRRQDRVDAAFAKQASKSRLISVRTFWARR